jgi:hypothetical protein
MVISMLTVRMMWVRSEDARFLYPMLDRLAYGGTRPSLCPSRRDDEQQRVKTVQEDLSGSG